MDDLIRQLRLQAEDLHVINPTSETVKCLSLAADEIERLNKEVLEQCRLNGMGSEREARLMAQITESQAEIDRLNAEIDNVKQVEFPKKVAAVAEGWRKKLTESQARERLIRHTLREGGCSLYAGMSVLKMKTDRTALDALLRAERAKERERIANMICYDMTPKDIADAIRELGDE